MEEIIDSQLAGGGGGDTFRPLSLLCCKISFLFVGEGKLEFKTLPSIAVGDNLLLDLDFPVESGGLACGPPKLEVSLTNEEGMIGLAATIGDTTVCFFTAEISLDIGEDESESAASECFFGDSTFTLIFTSAIGAL
jgi:hypothetical protein